MLGKLVNSRVGIQSRYVHGLICGHLGWCRPSAVDIQHGWRQEWISVVEVDLKLKNLPEAFRAKRIIQVSDLHCSRTVSIRYLRHCVDRVNKLEPDIVVLTGDYVTYDIYGKYRKKVVELLSGIKSKMGVFASLGNHDYGVAVPSALWRDSLTAEMVWQLQSRGVHVLVNEALPIDHKDQRIWMVGLGDLWANDFDPEHAFADIGADEVAIVLSHNPETAEMLKPYPAAAVLSGHTHGVLRQIHAEAGMIKVKRHGRHAGLYHLGHTQLYINRGLGRMGRALFNARPEITVFSLNC